MTNRKTIVLLIITAVLGVGVLIFWMPGKSFKETKLSQIQIDREIVTNLEKHVRVLAEDIGERNIWAARTMEATVAYVQKSFEEFGHEVSLQDFHSGGVSVTNVEITLSGGKRPEEIIVVGAHYDTVRYCPGANDNGSGVAVLLELARMLRNSQPDRTIRLVAFANEESPFFHGGTMGSEYYARMASDRKEKIKGMISLETMGYFSDVPGSQDYPFPFSLFYPEKANFIAFVGNLRSLLLIRKTIGAFREHASIASEGLAAPDFIPGVSWSDHRSFWKQGYPAIMITDTAFYRYDAYHTAHDLPEKLDFERLATVVQGLLPTVLQVASIE